MDFSVVQIYGGVKLLLLFFLAVSAYLIYKKKNIVYFLVLVGIISAGSYFLLVNDLKLLFWGLQGDEITIAAMYNTFAHVGFGSDFAYHELPPFYPSAFFWLFGAIGKIMNWNGVVIAKSAALAFFLFFPLILYYFQKYLVRNNRMGDFSACRIFAFLSPLLIITILDKDLLIGKPYEVIAAAFTVFWCANLYLKISRGVFNNKQALIYGAIAGIIFMVYYLWLVFAAIALFLMGTVDKKIIKSKYFLALLKTMLVAVIVGLPFTLPLAISFFRFGMESWQTAFFTPGGFDLWLPMFQLTSFNNLILLFGLAVLIYYRNNDYVKQLGFIFLTAFIWWGAGIFSLLVFKIPFQEFRGFYVLSPTVLAISAAYGIEKLWHYFKITDKKNLYFLVTIIGVMFFASQSIFGFFIDHPLVKARRTESKEINAGVANLSDYLKKSSGSSSRITLQTVPQVLAFTPINHLIYFNQHNNHPAAIFSERYQYVLSLTNSRSSDELYQKIKNCPYGNLERFIFYGDKDNYYLYFHLDKIIDGIEEKEIKIDKKLFETEYFMKIYDRDGYAIIDIK